MFAVTTISPKISHIKDGIYVPNPAVDIGGIFDGIRSVQVISTGIFRTVTKTGLDGSVFESRLDHNAVIQHYSCSDSIGRTIFLDDKELKWKLQATLFPLASIYDKDNFSSFINLTQTAQLELTSTLERISCGKYFIQCNNNSTLSIIKTEHQTTVRYSSHSIGCAEIILNNDKISQILFLPSRINLTNTIEGLRMAIKIGNKMTAIFPRKK